jgi:hypothetical protein
MIDLKGVIKNCDPIPHHQFASPPRLYNAVDLNFTPLDQQFCLSTRRGYTDHLEELIEFDEGG